MTAARSIDRDNDDDLLAAEYVLGVLPHAERITFARRLTEESRLLARVRYWEGRLSPLAEAIDPVAPPASVWVGIEQRLFTAEPESRGIWQSLKFWRSLAAASLATLALVAALSIGLPSLREKAQDNYVAELSGETNVVKLVVFYDAEAGVMKMNRIAGTPAANRDFELWLIEGSNKPMSLGVLPQQASATISLPREIVTKLGGAVLAISDEPKSGSPTGQPTGAVLAAGTLNSI
jgi:anti-sigma-K factor RskA